MNMLERLGYVLGWTGNVLAVLTLVGTAIFLVAVFNKYDSMEAVELSAVAREGR
jgi:hypothetical protein